MTAPAMSEADFQRQVTDLAERLGWKWAHFRPAQTQKGHWLTPVQGPLGKGFPDLVMVRDRVIFVELKKTGGRMSLEQVQAHRALEVAGAEHSIWYPENFDELEAILK